MKDATIAKNYAEALFTAAVAKRRTEQFGDLMDAVAGAVASDERIAVALESPRVAKSVKSTLLADALDKVAPAEFVRFLQAVVRRGRQGLFAEIAVEYQGLLDVRLNRVHAGVTLSTAPSPQLQTEIAKRLTAALGKEVRAHFHADKEILGGVVVRVGDRVYDGSLKRRLNLMRRQMLG